MPKSSLRSQLLLQRRALSNEIWQTSSRAAQLNLLSLDEYADAGCVALYAPTHNETDTKMILAAAFKEGKRVLYPAVCGNEMVFRPVKPVDKLQEGAFGISEPCPTGIDHQADEADLIVVPGVAFDVLGHRIGYGKGFYDRFLHNPACRAHLVGLCHDFQLTRGMIKTDPHDIHMGILVSDKRIIRIY